MCLCYKSQIIAELIPQASSVTYSVMVPYLKFLILNLLPLKLQLGFFSSHFGGFLSFQTMSFFQRVQIVGRSSFLGGMVAIHTSKSKPHEL